MASAFIKTALDKQWVPRGYLSCGETSLLLHFSLFLPSLSFAFPIEKKQNYTTQQQQRVEHDPYANGGRTHNSSVPEYDPYNVL